MLTQSLKNWSSSWSGINIGPNLVTTLSWQVPKNKESIGMGFIAWWLRFKSWWGHTKWWLVSDPNDKSKCNIHTLPSKELHALAVNLIWKYTLGYRQTFSGSVPTFCAFLLCLISSHILAELGENIKNNGGLYYWFNQTHTKRTWTQTDQWPF